MSSLRGHPEEKLDCLIREALNARVDNQEPPEHIWRQIVARLEADRAAAAMPVLDGVSAFGDGDGVAILHC